MDLPGISKWYYGVYIQNWSLINIYIYVYVWFCLLSCSCFTNSFSQRCGFHSSLPEQKGSQEQTKYKKYIICIYDITVRTNMQYLQQKFWKFNLQIVRAAYTHLFYTELKHKPWSVWLDETVILWKKSSCESTEKLWLCIRW